MEIIFEDLGILPYHQALDIQKRLFNQILAAKNEGNSTRALSRVLLCEHTPVFTLGKNGDDHNLLIRREDLERRGIDFVKVQRGGDITFHGPGQLVVYPILDLEEAKMGLRQYVNQLEECLLTVLQDYQIQAQRQKNAPGIWLRGQDKIAAIGIKASRKVTMHGLALNINTDLSYFDYINPCGFKDKGLSSMAKELGAEPSFSEVKKRFVEVFKSLWKAQKKESPV